MILKKKNKVEDLYFPMSQVTAKLWLSRQCGISIGLDIKLNAIELIYGQLIFNKGAETIQREKEKPFQQMVLGQLVLHMQKNEFGHLPHTVHKI